MAKASLRENSLDSDEFRARKFAATGWENSNERVRNWNLIHWIARVSVRRGERNISTVSDVVLGRARFPFLINLRLL